MFNKILVGIFLLFATPVWAVNEVGWTSTQQSMLEAADTANDATFEYIKTKVDGSGCQSGGNQFGLTEAYMYKITGNSSYCTLAYNRKSDCLSYAGRDKVRDCFLPLASSYSLCGNQWTTDQKNTVEGTLDAFTTKVSDGSFGTRPWDSDETIGNYFGLMTYQLARYGNLSNVPSNSFFGTTWGGVDCPSGSCSGIRKRIYQYFTELSDGEWIEGHRYNLNTIPYILKGVHNINDFYGSDKFPEITSLFNQMAENFYQKTAPTSAYGQFYKWGDILSTSGRSLDTDGSIKNAYMLSYFDNNNVNLKHLADYLFTQKSSCHQLDYLGYYNYATSGAKKSGVTSFNDSKGGLAYGHAGWSSGDIAVFSQMRKFFDVDHAWDAMQNWEVWKNNNWIVSARKHYYANSYIDQSYTSGLLAYGAFSGMREARQQTGYEAGSDYMYHQGVTSGFLSQRDKSHLINPFIDESTATHLFRYNPDGTLTGFIYNRIKACNPKSTSCIPSNAVAPWSRFITVSSNQPYVNLLEGSSSNADTTIASHHILTTFDCQPVKSGDKFSCTDGADTVEYYTFVDGYTSAIIPMSGNYYFNSPYYFSGTINPSEKTGYQLRIIKEAANTKAFYPFLNTIHIGSAADSYAEITYAGSVSTEAVQGAMVENGTDRVVFLASAQDKAPSPDFDTTFNGDTPVYDSSRLLKASKMSLFTQGSTASFTTDDTKNIEVFIVGLDPTKNWTITKNSAPAGCTVSANGICNFTISGAAQTHTVTWSAIGNLTCDDACSICADSTACSGSALTCYWHDNNGTTSAQCYNYDEPIITDTCDDFCSLCADESACGGSTQTCYWHDNNGETSAQCNNYPEPVVTTCDESCLLCGDETACGGSALTCYWHNYDGTVETGCWTQQQRSTLCLAGDVSFCDTEYYCDIAGFCWEDADCLTTCTTPPTYFEATLYSSGDVMLDSSAPTVNQDEGGLEVSITDGGSGGITYGETCNGAADDADSKTVSCTVSSCSDQIMVIAVTNEEPGDNTPNSVTFNGDAATEIDNKLFWYDYGNTTLWYLLNPDDVTGDLVVTYDASASVDIVIGAQVFCGVAQQAPEASCTGTDDCDITVVTQGALLVSGIGSVVNDTHSLSTGLTTKVYETSPPAYGMDGALGYGVAASTGSQGCGWTNTQTGDRSGTVCAAFEPASTGSASEQVSCFNFDLSAFGDIEVVGADITLTSNKSTSANGQTVNLFNSLRSWSESQATWNVYTTGNSWSVTGSRGVDSDIFGNWATGDGRHAFYTVNGALSAGSKVTLTPSSGFSLYRYLEEQSGSTASFCLQQSSSATPADLGFYDSENATQGNRPVLTLQYNPATVLQPLRRKKVINSGGVYSGKFGG